MYLGSHGAGNDPLLMQENTHCTRESAWNNLWAQLQ